MKRLSLNDFSIHELQIIKRERDILAGCVRDILVESFGEEFFEITWSVGWVPSAGKYPWFIRCGEWRAEFRVPGRSAEEACRRFQANLQKVRFNLDQCRLNQENGE